MSDPVRTPAVAPAKVQPSGDDGYVSIHLDESGATEFPFLLQRSTNRFGGSFGVSVAIHVAGLVLFGILMSIPAETTTSASNEPLKPMDLVWIAELGPGGGGGGGGNQQTDPPRKIEAPGQDKLTMPVAPKPKPDVPKPQEAPEPPPLEGASIPALAMASGLETIPGTPDGSVLPDSTSQGSGSGGGAGTGRGTGIGSGDGSGFGPGSGGGTGGGVYRPGSGITNPTIVFQVKPQYTAEAMRAKIQGQVWVEAVVLPDGTVGRVEVVRSLDSVFGLDQQALAAAKKWRFTPGLRLGQPVSVAVIIEMTFTLR